MLDKSRSSSGSNGVKLDVYLLGQPSRIHAFTWLVLRGREKEREQMRLTSKQSKLLIYLQ